MDYGIKAEAGRFGIQTGKPIPIPLPKLVFLIGSPAEASLFAAELTKSNPDILVADFESPLRESMHLLFWNGFDPVRNLTKPELRAEKLPNFDMTVEEFLTIYTDFIEDRLGADALGKMLKNTIFDMDGDLDVYSSYIFTDANTSRALPFLEKFGPKQCLFIYFGTTSIPMRHNHPFTSIASKISMPDVFVSDQLDLLRRELTGLST